MRKEPFIFRHFSKIFGVLFVVCLVMVVTLVTLGFQLLGEIQEQGLRGVIEEVWCGQDDNCLEEES